MLRRTAARAGARPSGGVYEFTHDPVGRVLGPYFACGGVEVWVTNDVVVVLGDSDHTLAPRCSPEDLRGVAEALDADA